MERKSAKVDVSSPQAAKGVLGYFINNLRARGRPAQKTLLGYVAAWAAWAFILWV